MTRLVIPAVISFVLLCGCQTSSRGIYSIPVTRDYQHLDKISVKEATEAIEKAELSGAAYVSPTQYQLASQYLAAAQEQARQGDRMGTRDYAGLAKSASEKALRESVGALQIEARTAAPTAEACTSEFDRAKARYAGLDVAKASQVAPFLYAHATVNLSLAEHDLKDARRWSEAAKALVIAQADMDTIEQQDTDGDGVPDMKDGAPRVQEDADKFEDEDGVADLDNDKDGVPDVVDKAPNEPETANGWHDEDGVPDNLPKLASVRFPGDSTTMDATGRGYLLGIKELLAGWPQLKVHLAGHSRKMADEAAAIDISRRLAETVQNFLIECGVPKTQLTVTFHGDTEPGEDGRTDSRVDLTFD